MTSTKDRLEYLRGEIRAERISYGELTELQDLAEHIDPSDVELLEWAGVPESCSTCGEALKAFQGHYVHAETEIPDHQPTYIGGEGVHAP